MKYRLSPREIPRAAAMLAPGLQSAVRGHLEGPQGSLQIRNDGIFEKMLLLFKHYGIPALGISLGLRRYFIVYPSSRHNTVTVYVASFKEKLCMMKRCDYCLKRQRGHWNKQVESNLCKVLFQKMLLLFLNCPCILALYQVPSNSLFIHPRLLF